ncbi:uncharacterized protein VNE69_02118 [Vairimorpha necatrix]|uniref:Uncharacterized protein n=1 Tax=Vairimorpha necatrix TaxID=6039 RepID=A0AAX4J9R2_9MICR
MLFSYIFFMMKIYCETIQLLLSLKKKNECIITIPLYYNASDTGSYVYILNEVPKKKTVFVRDILEWKLTNPDRCHYFEYSWFSHFIKNELNEYSSQEGGSCSHRKNYLDNKIFLETSITLDDTKDYYITGMYSKDNETLSYLYLTCNITFDKKIPIYSVECINLLRDSKNYRQPIPDYHDKYVITPHNHMDTQNFCNERGINYARDLLFKKNRSTFINK